MQALGLQIENQLLEMIESMVCQFYRFFKKLNVSDVRYGNWCKEKLPKTSKIQPTKDELRQYVKCVNYQAFILKNVLEAKQEIPGANQHGWSVIGNLCSSLDVQ